MKQNKAYIIAQAKALAKLKQLTNNNVPQIYACFCKVLTEKHGYTPEQIAELFRETQDCWNEITERDEIKDMIAWCEQTTGIILATED